MWPPSCRRGYGLQGSGSALALPCPGPGLCVFGAVLCAPWKAWEETLSIFVKPGVRWSWAGFPFLIVNNDTS